MLLVTHSEKTKMALTQPPMYWLTCAVVRAENREMPEANQSHSSALEVKNKGS